MLLFLHFQQKIILYFGRKVFTRHGRVVWYSAWYAHDAEFVSRQRPFSFFFFFFI